MLAIMLLTIIELHIAQFQQCKAPLLELLVRVVAMNFQLEGH